ncbi:MAG: triose-phosphate isomerase, partial [Bacteroidia bacterium]
FIRGKLLEKYGTETAENISILYGGSMKPDNSKELLSCKDIDGGLIGGAALESRSFVEIVKAI